MLRETGRREYPAASAPARTETKSQIEVAHYIESLAAELQTLSERAGHTTLTYLLSMVVLCAGEIAAEPSREGW